MTEETSSHSSRSKYEVTAFGKTYKSVRELAESHDIDSSVLYERVKAGATLEKAVKMGASKFSLIAFGKTFKSIRHLCEYYGIDYSIASKRIGKGHEPELVIKDLLTTNTITFEGNIYNSLIELCNEYEVHLTTVYNRLHSGWSLTEAVLKPIGRQTITQSYTFRGVTYNTQRDLTIPFGVSIDMVRDLSIKIGVDFIHALDILDSFLVNYKGNRPKKISRIPYVIYNDQWINTLKEFCVLIGIEVSEIQWFKKANQISSNYEALVKMLEHTRVRWIDKQTGEVSSRSKLVSLYRMDIRNLEHRDMAIKARIKAYPSLTFNPAAYFATPLLDFDEYINENHRRPNEASIANKNEI